MKMKKLLSVSILFLGLSFGLSAQNIEGDKGKTYYDAAKTKLKEVFAYKEISTFDPNNVGKGMKTTYVKYGPYFYYYENGKLKISGQYKDDKKTGEWSYYDEQGKLIKTEKYENDELVK